MIRNGAAVRCGSDSLCTVVPDTGELMSVWPTLNVEEAPTDVPVCQTWPPPHIDARIFVGSEVGDRIFRPVVEMNLTGRWGWPAVTPRSSGLSWIPFSQLDSTLGDGFPTHFVGAGFARRKAVWLGIMNIKSG